MKKIILSTIICLFSVISSFAEISSGITGACTWSYDSSIKELTISGSGAMANMGAPPWYKYRSSITSVAINEGVTSIENRAFDGCSSLKSVTIGNSVTSIGDYAFVRCSGLTSVIIPNSVTSIGSRAFAGCSGLTSVVIPNSVDSIGDYAFGGCSGLTSVTIGNNSVASIGDRAFEGCSGLKSVVIPNSVDSIGSFAFYNCSGLKSVTIGNSVISIGDYAFARCSGLTSVVIPNSVTSIGSYAFYDCSGLTSATIGNSVTSIGDYAFQKCRGLASVTIPNSVTSIGISAFYDCSNLENVRLEDGTTTLGFPNVSDAFANCPITNLYLGRNITGLPFQNKRTLTSVTISNSVTSIGNHAFQKCSGLTSVTIPNSVTSIGSYAFYECRGLTSVTIPNSVTSIGGYAFGSCSGLTTVEVEWPTPLQQINGTLFAGSNTSLNNTALYVPAGTKTHYENAPIWRNFTVIEQGVSGLVTAFAADTATITVTTADGGKTATSTVMLTGGTAIDDIDKDKLAVYPNPTRDDLFIKSNTPIEKIEIFDISGCTVETWRAASLQQGNSQTINVSYLPNGIYFVKISGNGKIIGTTKLIKN